MNGLNNGETIIPSGWYFCAESSEIRPGKLIAKKLFGQKVILWRTVSGVLNVSHSVCPHLGSDLGQLGRVEGEYLKCFSHDYTYNGKGDCIATGRKELPTCTKNVLRSFPVHEAGGFVIVWYDAESSPPTWTIPANVFAVDSKRYVRSNFEFKVSLEIINEDNFDVGHLYKWHNVYDIKTTPVVRNGSTISISHAFKRHSIIFKKPLKPPFNFLSREINSKYSSTLYGHGLTDSFIDIFNLNIHLQDLIWCTPITHERTMYTTFLRLLDNSDKRNIAKRAIDFLIRPLIFRSCVWRLRQEHKHEGHGFWERQSKVLSPILTETEKKLIDPYREWCTQFVNPTRNEHEKKLSISCST